MTLVVLEHKESAAQGPEWSHEVAGEGEVRRPLAAPRASQQGGAAAQRVSEAARRGGAPGQEVRALVSMGQAEGMLTECPRVCVVSVCSVEGCGR